MTSLRKLAVTPLGPWLSLATLWLFILSNSSIPYPAFQNQLLFLFFFFSTENASAMFYFAICIYSGHFRCSSELSHVPLVCNLVQVPLSFTDKWHTSLFIIIILLMELIEPTPQLTWWGQRFLRCCWFLVWIQSSISMCGIINYKAQWNGVRAKDGTVLPEGHLELALCDTLL